MNEPLLPKQKHVPEVSEQTSAAPGTDVVATRDHAVIRRWAHARHAEPATGEATASGPATLKVTDGGAGIRFNFPGTGRFRPISWEEWFGNFDEHGLAFVFEGGADGEPSQTRYRIVKADEWKGMIG